jgi:hypothetical protein
MSTTKIDLPQENGKYILNEEAVILILQAHYMHVCFETRNDERVAHKCWLDIGIKTKIKNVNVEAETTFRMPVNVRALDSLYDWEFFHRVDLVEPGGALHPILGLIKKGTILEFEPYEGAHTNNLLKEHGLVGDVIYWHVVTKGNRYKNIFAAMTTYDSSLGKLIKKTRRTNLNPHTTATHS